jgi:hypothetical protein
VRAGTAFLLTLALLLGAGVAADALVTRQAEREAGALAENVLGAPADVTLTGWPVGLRLVAGRVQEVRVVATQVPLETVTLSRLDVRLADVRLRLADLERGAVELRGARGGSVTVELDEAAVGTLAGLPGGVRLGEGIGQVETPGGAVDVAVSVETGAIVLRPIGSAPEAVTPVVVEVPSLPGNPTLDEVRITRGVLRITGRLVRFRLAEFSSFALSS